MWTIKSIWNVPVNTQTIHYQSTRSSLSIGEYLTYLSKNDIIIISRWVVLYGLLWMHIVEKIRDVFVQLCSSTEIDQLTFLVTAASQPFKVVRFATPFNDDTRTTALAEWTIMKSRTVCLSVMIYPSWKTKGRMNYYYFHYWKISKIFCVKVPIVFKIIFVYFIDHITSRHVTSKQKKQNTTKQHITTYQTTPQCNTPHHNKTTYYHTI